MSLFRNTEPRLLPASGRLFAKYSEEQPRGEDGKWTAGDDAAFIAALGQHLTSLGYEHKVDAPTAEMATQHMMSYLHQWHSEDARGSGGQHWTSHASRAEVFSPIGKRSTKPDKWQVFANPKTKTAVAVNHDGRWMASTGKTGKGLKSLKAHLSDSTKA